MSAGVGGGECVAKDPVLATTEIKCEDDYYLSETPRPLLRPQPHPPMPSPESEPEDIESDVASTATTTTTEDTESYDIRMKLLLSPNFDEGGGVLNGGTQHAAEYNQRQLL